MFEEIPLPTRGSAVRHRPIASDAKNTQVQTPRASRVKQEPPKWYAPDDMAFDSAYPTPRQKPKASRMWLIYLVLGMFMALLLLWLGQMLLNWGMTVSDDLHYGRPRTTNIDHAVGHETGVNTLTHFTALNLGGQVYIIEIPGGSPNTSHLLVGPHLIGANSDLAPVSLSFTGAVDHPDLLISVNHIEMLFRNTGSSYVPAS